MKATRQQAFAWLAARSQAKPNGCIEWQRANINGYGVTTLLGEKFRTHRLAWEAANGPIPAGMVICHRCDNPPCCNPAHLFLGTQADNMADMREKGRDSPDGFTGANRRKTHCPQGHGYTPDNTYLDPKGTRRCRICRRHTHEREDAIRAAERRARRAS